MEYWLEFHLLSSGVVGQHLLAHVQLADWLFALRCCHLGGRGKAARGRSRRRSGWANRRLLPSAVRLRRRGNGMLVRSKGQGIDRRWRRDVGQVVVGLKGCI